MVLTRRRFVLVCGATSGFALLGCGDRSMEHASGTQAVGPSVALEPTPRWTVSARVTAAGAPVEGAVVLFTPRDPAVVARAQPGRAVRPIHAVTDRLGRVSLPRVAAGRYGVSATAPGYFPARADVTIDESRSELSLSLVAGALDVRGSVLDVHGKAVRGALVLAHAMDFGQRRWFGHAAVTDDHGRYRLSTDRQVLFLRVVHPRMAQVWSSGARPGTPLEVHDFRMERAAVVGGIVRSPEGVPVQGALVLARPVDGAHDWVWPGRPEAFAATDGEGRFTIDRLRAGAVELSAVARQWATPAPQVAEVGIGRKHDSTELVVVPAHVVSGRIQRGTEDLSGHFFVLEDALHGATIGSLAPSGDDGRFAIEGVLPGELAVLGGWPDVWMGRTIHRVRVHEQGADPIELIALPDPGVVGGVTVHVEGATAGDVVLEASSHEKMPPIWLLHPRPIDPHGPVVFDLVPVGHYTAWARTPDGAHGRTDVSVEAGVDASIVIVPRAHAELRGHVRDERGAPLADASVVTTPVSGPGSDMPVGWSAPRARSDAAGEFVIRGLVAGGYALSVMASGRTLPWADRSMGVRWEPEHIDVEDEHARIERELRVERPGAWLKGRVVGPDGAPRAHVRVGLRHAVVERADRGRFGEPRTSSTFFPDEPLIATDEEGRFAIAGLLAGDHELHAVDPLDGAHAREGVAAPADEIVVRLAAPARLTGRVTHGGTPTSRFALQVTDAGGCAGGRAGAGGRIDIIRIPAGHHDIGVAAPEGQLLFDVHLAAGRSLAVDVELQPWAEIEGRATDASGTPLAGLEVSLVEPLTAQALAFGHGSDVQTRTVFTAADGRFHFERVFPGLRRIRLEDPSRRAKQRAEREVEAKAGETTALGTIVVS